MASESMCCLPPKHSLSSLSCEADTDHHRCIIGWRSGELGGQGNLECFIMVLKPFNVCNVAERIIQLKEAPAIGDHHCHEGVYLVQNHTKVRGTLGPGFPRRTLPRARTVVMLACPLQAIASMVDRG